MLDGQHGGGMDPQAIQKFRSWSGLLCRRWQHSDNALVDGILQRSGRKTVDTPSPQVLEDEGGAEVL